MTLSEGGAVATKSVDDNNYRTVASKVVIRPAWDVEGGMNVQHAGGHCFYCMEDGCRLPGNGDWHGMQNAKEGDRIGMLLDLDQGSMTVWKNDEKLAGGNEGREAERSVLLPNNDASAV